MSWNFKKFTLTLTLLGVFFSALVYAQTDTETRQQLETELQAIESQITELEKQLSVTKGEKNTLANNSKVNK